jgi:2-oxoglutarate ferredoxin oxidoreductase subunit gamma
MHQEMILAGAGGQGIMVIGQLLAYAALVEDKNVLWFPSYGPESRGGTADCTVIIATEEIGSPVLDSCDCLIALNQPSLDRFASAVRPGGIIAINSSLAALSTPRDDCKVISIPANDIAAELGNLKVVNMIMLGAFVSATSPVSLESVIKALADVLPPHRHNLLPLNEQALRRGAELLTAV